MRWLVTTMACGVLVTVSLAPASATTGSQSKAVSYGGVTVEVPVSWPVVDYSHAQTGCVRFDRHAVYLGDPRRSDCPSGLVGQTEAVQITPPGVTVTSGGDPSLARSIRASIQAPAPAATVRSHRDASAARPEAVKTTGSGFDACTAPSESSMQSWLASPYRSVNIYIGGAARACSQANLTASWVSDVSAMGWALIPTYVGLQAPCAGFSNSIDPSNAASQGTQAADDAINEMTALALGAGNPVYFDMESYDTSNSGCVQAVETFLDAWTAELHARGYVSGVYSSAASGITNLVQESGNSSYHLPDDIWFAHWNGSATVYGDSYIPDSMWNNHQRIHQYQGGHNETYGGVTINIDNDAVDGDTASPAASASPPTGSLETVMSPAPDRIAVTGWAFDPDTPNSPTDIQMYVGGPPGSAGAQRFDVGDTDVARPDVQSAYPQAGPDTGFEATVTVAKPGTYPVYVYAINTGPGDNTLLGSKTATLRATTGRLVATIKAGRHATVKPTWVCAVHGRHSAIRRHRTSAGRCAKTSHGVAKLEEVRPGRWHLMTLSRPRQLSPHTFRVKPGKTTRVTWRV